MKTLLHHFRQNKKIRVFVRQLCNITVLAVAGLLADMDAETMGISLVLATPLMNLLTKYVNTKLLDDLGVDKEDVFCDEE